MIEYVPTVKMKYIVIVFWPYHKGWWS